MSPRNASPSTALKYAALPMDKRCEARVWRPALLSEVLFSLDVTCEASQAAPHEQRPKSSRRSLHFGRDDSGVVVKSRDDFGVYGSRNSHCAGHNAQDENSIVDVNFRNRTQCPVIKKIPPISRRN